MKHTRYLKATTLTISLLLLGCAKEKPYDSTYKEVELLSKNQIITEEVVKLDNGKTEKRPVEYLYVPMTLGTPMNVTEADPFFQGQEKVVKLQWSEEGIEVFEIEKDPRYADNRLNEYPVLTIPGEYKDYRCKQDAYGECTNVEEENREVSWDKKRNFLPKLAEIKIRELNQLDIFTLNNGACLSEGDTKLVNYEISPGVINVELEKTYKVNASNFSCFIQSFYEDQLKTNGFSVRKFYSLVRLDKLTTKAYKPVTYETPDQSDFGFFAKKEKVLENDFDRSRSKVKTLMERWHPGVADDLNTEQNELAPRTIKYYLSPEFSKNENSYILEATKDAIETMNREMLQSKVPLQIKAIEQPNPKVAKGPGDLRYSSIVLIEDPLANGLLGYGPSVSNPYTGEIVKAHTNMYLGVLKSQTRYIYQAAVDLSKEKSEVTEVQKEKDIKLSPEALTTLPKSLVLTHFPELAASLIPSPPKPPVVEENNNDSDNPRPPSVTEEEETERHSEPKNYRFNPTAFHDNNSNGHHHAHGHLSKFSDKNKLFEFKQKLKHRIQTKQNNDYRPLSVINRLREEGNLTEDKEIMLKEEARLNRYAENNAFAVEFLNIGGTSKVIYPELLKVKGITKEQNILKSYDDLTSEQKSKVQKIILTNSFKATLIHEIGHNLGLRHNFLGSWDSENFYTEDEAQSLGMNSAPAYSSIMDYSFSEYNQLKAFGKYDLAALRFGYSRQVELSNGKFSDIKGSLYDLKNSLENGVTLKSYQYCTDENAGLSSTCNRFDEGTTLVEITQHLISKYKNNYKYRNFRDGRLDYSSYNLPLYLFSRQREFMRIRNILEEYEFFAGIFSKKFLEVGCSPEEVNLYPVCKMVNDRRDAVKIIGDFFAEILSTPDHICALSRPSDLKKVVSYRKLSDIYEDLKFQINYVPKSCFDEKVKEFLITSTDAENQFVPIGEAGKYFNSFKDNNPNYRFVTDRYVLGTWADKLMTFKVLFKRDSDKGNTDENHMALMDVPYIKESIKTVLDHYILGRPLQTLLPFKTEKGTTFTTPYAIQDDYKIEMLESAYSWLRGPLGLPVNGGKGDLLQASLNQTKTGVDYGLEYREDVIFARNLTAVDIKYGTENDPIKGDVYFFDSDYRITYSASSKTPYAFKMITAINKFPLLERAGRVLVNSISRARNFPAPPEELSPEDRLFFLLPPSLQEQLLMFSGQGAVLPEEVFVGNLGEEIGPEIFKVYQKGEEYLKNILKIKEEASNTPPSGSPDYIKDLFKLPKDLLDDYALGFVTLETLEYYKKQLRKMPPFKQ